MFKKILLPLDGSKLAEQVFPHIAKIAVNFDSEVTLVSVCEPEESEYGHVCRLYIGSETEKFRGIIDKAANVKVSQAVLEGKAAEKILEYARGNGIDLIIVSSHGRSGVSPWSLGSTVNKILHKVGVPLIIVKAKEKADDTAESTLFNRILVPLDGSPKSAMVLPHVIELTKKIESEVVFFQAVEAGHHIHTIGGLDYIPFKDRDLDKMREKAEVYFNEVSQDFKDTKAKIKYEFRFGDPAKEIIKVANEIDASMVALASHVHSGIESWFYGSVTNKLLQSTTKSVLLVSSHDNKG